jgi:hypothetical protein
MVEVEVVEKFLLLLLLMIVLKNNTNGKIKLSQTNRIIFLNQIDNENK